jgi:hypothetical protein
VNWQKIPNTNNMYVKIKRYSKMKKGLRIFGSHPTAAVRMTALKPHL